MNATAKPVSDSSLDARRFLSVAEVAQLLKVSRTTLYTLLDRKHNPLPSVLIGKSRRFPFDKVLAWMETLAK